MKLSVVYDIKDLPEDIPDRLAFDDDIIDALKKIGFKWWASGTDRETGKRDLAFDYEET